MPPNDGIWLYYDKSSFPPWPESEEGDPEDAIERRDLGFGFLLAVCVELLAERQFDKHLLVVASEQSRGTAKNERKKVE